MKAKEPEYWGVENPYVCSDYVVQQRALRLITDYLDSRDDIQHSVKEAIRSRIICFSMRIIRRIISDIETYGVEMAAVKNFSQLRRKQVMRYGVIQRFSFNLTEMQWTPKAL